MKWNIGNAKGVNKNGHNRINKKQAETGFNKCSKNLLGILEKQEQGLLEITVPKKDRFLNLWGKAAAEPNQPFFKASCNDSVNQHARCKNKEGTNEGNDAGRHPAHKTRIKIKDNWHSEEKKQNGHNGPDNDDQG